MKAVRALFGEFRTGQGLKGQLLRGGFWSLVIKLMSTLMALVLAVVLARLLGAEGFGVYSFVLALVTILAIPAQMGLPNLVVRETAKAQVAQRFDLMKGLWQWSSLVALAMSAGLIALGALAAWLFAENLGVAQAQTLWWGLLLVPLVALGNLRGAALRGLRKVVQGQLPEFVLRPLFLILLALLAVFVRGQTLGPAEAMMLHVAAALAAFIIGGWLLLRERPAELAAQTTASTEGKAWLASALPLALIGGMQVINANVGVVVLGLFRDAEEVGLFRVAMQGAMIVSLGLAAANQVMAPHIARLYAEKDMSRLQTLAMRGAALSSVSALPILIVVALWGEEILFFLFGSEFVAARFALLIVGTGQFISALMASVGLLLSMSGYAIDAAKVTVVTVLANVVLSFILGYIFGMNGVAFASAASVFLQNIVLNHLVKQRLGIESSAAIYLLRAVFDKKGSNNCLR